MTDCICGAVIRKVRLPNGIARAAGGKWDLWVHESTFSTLCYPDDDPDCHAQPDELLQLEKISPGPCATIRALDGSDD